MVVHKKSRHSFNEKITGERDDYQNTREKKKKILKETGMMFRTLSRHSSK